MASQGGVDGLNGRSLEGTPGNKEERADLTVWLTHSLIHWLANCSFEHSINKSVSINQMTFRQHSASSPRTSAPGRH